jgi:glucokinase
MKFTSSIRVIMSHQPLCMYASSLLHSMAGDDEECNAEVWWLVAVGWWLSVQREPVTATPYRGTATGLILDCFTLQRLEDAAMSAHRTTIKLAQAHPPFFVGVDVGGTNIKIGVVDDLGETLVYRRIPTQATSGPDEGARRMGQAVREMIVEAGLTLPYVARIGLGTPGTMDVGRGVLIHPHNLPGWHDFPIRDRLKDEAGLPVTYANDANAAAYGEFWIGSGRDFHSLVLLTLGTGVGCGIIIGDLVVVGEHYHGAESGHMIIDCNDNARMCGCGHRGHLEAYASATAVISRTEEALAAGRKSSMTVRLEKGAKLTPLLVAEEATAGDRLATEIVMDTARYVGVGIVSLMHTIDPSGVLIGGAMTFGGNDSELGQRFLARVREEVHRRALPVPAEKTAIEFASLGADAGYIGAAGMARVEYRRK